MESPHLQVGRVYAWRIVARVHDDLLLGEVTDKNGVGRSVAQPDRVAEPKLSVVPHVARGFPLPTVVLTKDIHLGPKAVEHPLVYWFARGGQFGSV